MSDIPKPKLDALEDYFLHVGFLTAYWNKAEEELDDLLSCLVGDPKKAYILTGALGISKRLSFCRSIIQECYSDADWAEAAISALEAFDVLRRNRNVIIHGIASRLDLATGVVSLKAATQNPKSKNYKLIALTRKEVVRELDDVIKLGNYLINLRRYAFPNEALKKLADFLRGPPTLPEKYPLPDDLPSLPSPSPKKPKALPPPSQV